MNKHPTTKKYVLLKGARLKQPDFSDIFAAYFGGVPRKVRYGVRYYPNRLHDIVFLSSLIHDARFKVLQVHLRGKRLVIDIERDCWELARRDSNELYIPKSRLIFSPVDSVEWCFKNGFDLAGTELWINTIFLDPLERKDFSNFIIKGDHWSCIVKLSDKFFRILLQDQEIPYLYSEIHKK